MDARSLLKRLREEKKASKSNSCPIGSSGGDENKNEAHGRLEASATTNVKQKALLVTHVNEGSKRSDGDASLMERTVTISTTSSDASSSPISIELLEDPTGTLAGGNGATLWDCSLALSNYVASSHFREGHWVDKTILELGAGLGLVGMTLASLGANVVVTERAIAIPLLERNVARNTDVTDGRVEVAELSWGAESTRRFLEKRRKAEARPFDLIVGADLVFPSNCDAYPMLADSVQILLQESGDGGIKMWQSHEPRKPEIELKYWELLQERGIKVSRITSDLLPESHPDDIEMNALQLI